MTKDLAKTEERAKNELAKYLQEFVTGKNLTPQETKDFINIAQVYGLNPFKREIHVVAYGKDDKRQCSIIVGYEIYIKRAERTGKLNGWKVEITGAGEDMAAKITINRKDWEMPFEHEVYLSEAQQYKKDYQTGKQTPTAIWQKMPKFMLKKVAIAQGFRLCFSDELGGMPYTENELNINNAIDITPGKPAVEQPRSKSAAEKFETAAADSVEAEGSVQASAADGDNIELLPSNAIFVDPASVIPAVKAFVFGAEIFITSKGSAATKVIIADSPVTRRFEMRFMGDKTADFYRETYYRFFEVKTGNVQEDKIFTCKRYEQVIDME